VGWWGRGVEGMQEREEKIMRPHDAGEEIKTKQVE
jgi:hypothetical protein